MAVQALIKFTQGMTVGAAGAALIGAVSVAVQASNGGVGDQVLTYKWTWIDVPHFSALVRGLIVEGNAPVVNFTPDVVGDYHLELEVFGANGSSSKDRRVFRVVRLSGRAIPAFDAEAPAMNFSGRARGWAPDMEAWLEYLDSLVIGGGASPGGSVGDLQFHAFGDFFDGTGKLTYDGTRITHTGKPIHAEDYARFLVTGGSTSEARSQWLDHLTSDASAHSLGTIVIPATDYGDGVIIVMSEAAVCYNSSGVKGGNRSLKATYIRSSGTLSKIFENNLTDTSQWSGTVVADFSTSKVDDDTISINGTGISSTDVQWFPSVHVIFAKKH